MASNPPGPCCFRGYRHEDEVNGEMTTFAGYEAYVKYPPSKSTEKALVFLPDAFGHVLRNSQLLCDKFAAEGYFVVMPDLFFGDYVRPEMLDADFQIPKWLAGDYDQGHRKVSHDPESVDPIVEAVIRELKSDKYAAKSICAAGYCFGGRYVVRYLNAKGFNAGYIAHPSFVKVEEIKEITNPLAIGAAEVDVQLTREKRLKSEEILAEKKVPYQINLYSGVEHGFACRGDPMSRTDEYAKENTFLQAVQWFAFHLD